MGRQIECASLPRAFTAARIVTGRAAGTHLVSTRGQTSVERVFSLLLLGDLVSVYLAVLGGQDPQEIGAIDELKSRLSRA